MPTLQICSAQSDNQILYVSNDTVENPDYFSSSQNYSSYEASGYQSSYRSSVSNSYDLYNASNGSLELSEYSSRFSEYGSSYGSSEEGFQMNVHTLIGQESQPIRIDLKILRDLLRDPI